MFSASSSRQNMPEHVKQAYAVGATIAFKQAGISQSSSSFHMPPVLPGDSEKIEAALQEGRNRPSWGALGATAVGASAATLGAVALVRYFMNKNKKQVAPAVVAQKAGSMNSTQRFTQSLVAAGLVDKGAAESIDQRIPESKVDGKVPASDKDKDPGHTQPAPDPKPDVEAGQNAQEMTTGKAPDDKLAAYNEGMRLAFEQAGIKMSQIATNGEANLVKEQNLTPPVTPPPPPAKVTPPATPNGFHAADWKATGQNLGNIGQGLKTDYAIATDKCHGGLGDAARNLGSQAKQVWQGLPGAGKGLAIGAGGLGALWLLRKMFQRKQAPADKYAELAYAEGFVQHCTDRGVDAEAVLNKSAADLASQDPEFAKLYMQYRA